MDSPVVPDLVAVAPRTDHGDGFPRQPIAAISGPGMLPLLLLIIHHHRRRLRHRRPRHRHRHRHLYRYRHLHHQLLLSLLTSLNL